MTPPRDGGFGLYVHWPFCQAKCPYCDFNSHVVAQVDQERWARAFEREIERLGILLPGRTLDSVYFGGGTPSLMPVETVARILDGVRQTWSPADDWEVTLEANPTSVEAARFTGYRRAGVNRVSLGVQALNDRDLHQLGRLHSAQEARDAVILARTTFPRVSFDLIYARQDQTRAAWESELAEALELAADHLSLYQLTIEPDTAFGLRAARGGLLGLPNEDLAADLYEMTVEMCAGAGFDAYEISNFARGGAVGRHNLIYWSGGDYAGIGPGAHGRLTIEGRRHATETPRGPEAWLQAVEAGTPEIWEDVPLEEQATEYLLMGLRVRQGVRLDRLNSMNLEARAWTAIERLIQERYLASDGTRIWAEPSGRIVLDALLREILS